MTAADLGGGAGPSGRGDEAFIRVSSGWLALREPADAAARAVDLVEQLVGYLGGQPVVVHDLGCGTGSMGRWLAPLLPGPQHWIMHDRDPDLLAYAVRGMAGITAGGVPVTATARRGDIADLTAADLTSSDSNGAAAGRGGLVTASALLDILTAEEVERIAAASTGAGCPALLTLSVVGHTVLTPADPLDAPIAAAFNAHQRRTAGGRTLLGPDAVDAVVDAYLRRGASVLVRPSPWRLCADSAELAGYWLRGWLDAACEQAPELAEATVGYRRRRLAEAAAGRLEIMVGHCDVLAWPPARR